jgi:methylase of polypeptide subunit release factors
MVIKQGDMIKLMQEEGAKYFEKFDLVISNPPYISVREYQQSLQKQVRRFESKLALVGE